MLGINLSLRRYILATLLGLGTVIIVTLSILWTNHFFAGLDGMMRGTMINMAQSYAPKKGQPERVHNYIIAASWRDLPAEINSQFDPTNLVNNQLYKQMIRDDLYSQPKQALFVIKTLTEQGEARYVAHLFDTPNTSETPPWYELPEMQAILFAIAALSVFTLMLIALMRTIAKPVAQLSDWAASLDDKSLNEPAPHFKYRELNTLANLIQQSLQEVNHSLKREKEFVNHASHELRTPIAVIRSSVELIQRLNDPLQPKSYKALQRIDHASHEMAALSETLLWLSRQEKPLLDNHLVNLDKMLAEQRESLSYLLKGKEVTVMLNTEPYLLSIPRSAVQIVIGNLLRNAYQHTHHGIVEITQKQNYISISNTEYDSDCEYSLDDQQNLGYGLGLELVKRLCKQLDWHFHIEITANRCEATLQLVSTHSHANDS
ncbi:sensor histidine kinase [Pseudoalteromonas sp. T1lg65]|uniref:sensor histidine kinase n=1 Tax=Pseudoalteromonas sp. T1lg65 TaxID=2077101 RepID=UPI003F7A67F2